MTQASVHPSEALPHEEEFDLLALLTVIGTGKRVLGSYLAIGLVVGLALAFLLPPTFTAKTVILPPQQQQSTALSALANLGAVAGVAGVGSLKTPDDLYVAFLSSERIENALIERFQLRQRYDEKWIATTRKELEKNTHVSSDKKSGLITIAVDDKDPSFAAQMANAYVEELSKMLSTIAVSDAQQKRVFFEQQVYKTQEGLAKAEERFKELQQKSGLQSTDALASTGIKASIELRSQIATREVQLQALRSTYATAQNPDAQRLASELAALRAQLVREEQGTPTNGPNDATSTGQAAAKAYRDVKVQESLLEALVRQYELAKVDEAREGPLLQQVDIAVAPERKSKPQRALVILLCTFAGLIVGLLAIFGKAAVARQQATEVGREKLHGFYQAWRFARIKSS